MSDNESTAPNPRDRTLHVPPRTHNGHQQAAEVTREHINRIYQQSPPNQAQAQPINQQSESPYARTHQPHFDWSKYHSAWQQYYQQYYQRFYWQQLHTERQKISEQLTKQHQQVARAQSELQIRPVNEQIVTGQDTAVIPQAKDQLAKLKQDIVGQVKQRASKVHRSQHFVPIISALAVGLLLLFLQFNTAVIAQVRAYVSPGALSGDAITIDPTAPIEVGDEPRLIIPKINVDVPVDYTIKTVNENEIQQSLRDGTTHYNLPGANAVPGQYGNAVILGHSSNDFFNQGEYKFVFVLLDRLEPGDTYYMHYEGKRYTYRVTEKKVINPTDITALRLGNAKPMSTLITCTPPGTALQRLIVIGEQINPDPSGATKPKPAEPQPNENQAILPGNEPTLLEQIWSFFF